MEGHGLNHFSKIYDVTSINGQRIISWKIDWEGNSTIVVDEWVNKTTTSTSSPTIDVPSIEDIQDKTIEKIRKELEDVPFKN